MDSPQQVQLVKDCIARLVTFQQGQEQAVITINRFKNAFQNADTETKEETKQLLNNLFFDAASLENAIDGLWEILEDA